MAAPTFCKCICFKNSTIIPLGPEHQQKRSLPPLNDPRDSSSRSPPLLLPTSENGADAAAAKLSSRSASTSCSECTKAFCLDQGIPFCKDATEDDVFTQCFQRDSHKDKIMVWVFIVATVGLLGWAVFKRVSEWHETQRLGRQDIAYSPVPVAGR